MINWKPKGYATTKKFTNIEVYVIVDTMFSGTKNF